MSLFSLLCNKLLQNLVVYDKVLSFAPDSMDQQFGPGLAGQLFLAGLIHMTVASDQSSGGQLV